MAHILTATVPQLVPVESLAPSTYNPRTADEKRLALIELSLRKLGWLLPGYAVPDGELLSGHQRHLVAVERLHARRIPVVYTKAMPLEKRKPVNIMFNRATNDLKRTDTSHTITARLDAGSTSPAGSPSSSPVAPRQAKGRAT